MRTVEADICVIGAGPAGVTFASEWIGAPQRLAILESGVFGDDEAAQDLSDGPVRSDYHDRGALAVGRMRRFGGTANLWGYRIVPDDGRRYARSIGPEALDLEPTVRRPGWGRTLAELSSLYERAQRAWTGGPDDDRVETWGDASTPELGCGDGELVTRMVQHGPSDVFTLHARDRLQAAPNVEILVGTTVTELESDADGSVIVAAVARTRSGSTVRVVARTFVLAAGAIENVQLLLLSAAGRPGGPGNRHDLVGRRMSDHLEFRMGVFHPGDRGIFDRLGLYDIRRVRGSLVSGTLALSEEVRRDEALPGVGVALVPQGHGFGSSAHRSLVALAATRKRSVPAHPVSHAKAIARQPRETLRTVRHRESGFIESVGGWSGPDVDKRGFETVEAHAAAEVVAGRDDRIVLDDGLDGAGRRRPRLAWSISSDSRAETDRAVDRLARVIASAGLGRFERWMRFAGSTRPRNPGFHHPMGGTPMHPEPEEGVVDIDGRVHGLSNLYVTGSSTFPNGHGYANPTLTILALAIGLADHLKNLIG